MSERAIITTLHNLTLPQALSILVADNDDADLLVRMRRRDPESMGTLYDRYGRIAYTLALQILRDPEAAESAVSEAAVRCWNRIALFRETRACAVGIWFVMVTYFAALGMLPGQEQNRFPAALELAPVFGDWSKSLDPEKVHQCYIRMQNLDPDEKDLLDLTFFAGLTPAELVNRTGRPQPEVDKLIAALLTKLSSVETE